jgi:16S rRNA (guanine527-N7)-methyltransferase
MSARRRARAARPKALVRQASYGPVEFQRDTGVSRETLARLETYAALLLKWNKQINLIGRGSEPDIWRRHILDSAQLLPLIPENARFIADVGAGAGLPGLILSILNSAASFALIEPDRRKAAFLREAIRATQSTAIVHNFRVEEVDLTTQDVVVARALAPLDKLLEMVEKLLSIHTVCIFPKGATAEQELTTARARWKMLVRQVPSRTDPAGRILVLTEVARVRP